MDDEQTLPACLAQDLDHYFWEMAASYQDRLYALAFHLTGSVQDAEDIVQEALLGAYITLSHYPVERIRTLKLRPWLYKLTLNVFRNSRRKSRLPAIPLDLSEESQVLDLSDPAGDNPELFFENTESQQEMAKLVLALPEPLAGICYPSPVTETTESSQGFSHRCRCDFSTGADRRRYWLQLVEYRFWQS